MTDPNLHTRAEVDLSEMVGREYAFHGAHSNAFMLDGVAYEVVEDENDGYRSAMDYVRVVAAPTGFFDAPIARVKMIAAERSTLNDGYNEDVVWHLVDVSDGHVWLEFGTRDHDDYYPMFWFDYRPEKPDAEDCSGAVDIEAAKDNARTHIHVTRQDIGHLAGLALDEMRAKADENAKRGPLPVRQEGKDEIWVMCTPLQDGRVKSETITPLPSGMSQLVTYSPCQAAVEPDVLHAFACALEACRIENKHAARERAARAEVRIA